MIPTKQSVNSKVDTTLVLEATSNSGDLIKVATTAVVDTGVDGKDKVEVGDTQEIIGVVTQGATGADTQAVTGVATQAATGAVTQVNGKEIGKETGGPTHNKIGDGKTRDALTKARNNSHTTVTMVAPVPKVATTTAINYR